MAHTYRFVTVLTTLMKLSPSTIDRSTRVHIPLFSVLFGACHIIIHQRFSAPDACCQHWEVISSRNELWACCGGQMPNSSLSGNSGNTYCANVSRISIPEFRILNHCQYSFSTASLTLTFQKRTVYYRKVDEYMITCLPAPAYQNFDWAKGRRLVTNS